MSVVVRATAITVVLGAALASSLRAQELTILDARVRRQIAQEISGDASYEHIRFMTQFHRPGGGANGLWTVAEYYERKAKEFGLDDVRLIRQRDTDRPWNAKFADLWIVEPEPTRLASTIQSPLHLADNSRATDVTAEIVDIGAGDSTAYAGRDVKGKIVLTYGPLGGVMREAVLNRGALGVIWYPSPFSGPVGIVGAGPGMPDQVRWISIPSGAVDGKEPTFAFGLSLRQGIELRNRLAAARTPVKARAVVDAGWTSTQGDEPWQVMVEGSIRGTDTTLAQDIVLTGHLQEEHHSANDDASGCANVLEIARALNRLIAEGRIPRPRRTIRFWWVTEISSQRRYFADHPDAHRRIWVNVNQDMVGANQALDVMRKQNVTRVPATRFHFLNDVTEAVVEHLVRTNTFELAQAGAGIPMYPEPVTAHFGSQHRYNAEMIWFHLSTDHMPFLEAPIGIPAITFTNMPDRYIHSSDDDLWNIDATQLGRNAVAAATIAYVMASADSGAVTALAAETHGRGLVRLAQNVRLGLTWIATATDRAAAYRDAVDQVRYAAERERMALASLGQIHSAARARAAAMIAEVGQGEAQALRDLDAAYRRATGRRAPAAAAPDSGGARLATLRPALTGGPKEFQEKRGEIRGVPGLHGLMAFEVLNAVDGRRTGLDIWRFVAAEAREAGAHYYGTVRAADVLKYLENAAAAGLIRLN
jgi:hypothetical protein